MKKVMLLFMIAIFVSCSNMNSKLENSLSKEIGKEPTSSELIGKDKKSQRFVWKDVSLGLQNSLKNTIDKEFGILPTKTSELNNDIDEMGNTLKGNYYQYWSYENTKHQIELSYHFEDAKPNTMTVNLYITSK